MAARILIVDDVATNRIVLKVKLTSARYDTLQVGSGAAAIEVARRDQPDAILLDVVLPDQDGITICRELKSDPRTRHIPVIIVTALDDTEARTKALMAGADDFLSKPLDDLALLARLRSVIRARETETELQLREATGRDMGFAEPAAGFAGREAPGNVVLVTARPENAITLRRSLRQHMGAAEISTLTRDEALSGIAAAGEADVFLIEAGLEQREDGLRLMSDLRSRPATRHAAICILLPENARDTGAMALDLGAADILSTSWEPLEIALRLQTQVRRKRRADRLRCSMLDGIRLASIDPLTGLHNRRYALPDMERIAQRAAEKNRHYAVMVLDIDRFKSVNDTWGHAVGDVVLSELASRLREIVGPNDLLARIGGEEFLIVMPDTDLPSARKTAERLRMIAEQRAVKLPSGEGSLAVTVSIGLAIGGGAASPGAMEIMQRADIALLNAKAVGRNQVMIGLCPAA